MRLRLDVPLTLVYRAEDNVGPTATFTRLLQTLAGEKHPAVTTEHPQKKAAR